ncbi:MAG: HPr(Ser) kinase/phosphatase [Deltaproteobacteria bacterium]|nr:HPr(Ser) kinase/phosphatase [Deltaproteobacteria bacterium]
MRILAQALYEDKSFDLRLELLAGHNGLGREIAERRIQKPGLAIAGFVEMIQQHRVQVLGNTEISYLQSLNEEQQRRAIENFFASGLSCAVLTTALPVPPYLAACADRESVPLFRSTHSSWQFIAQIHEFLEDRLSPEISRHGVLVDVFGVGVLLTGPSGIGKSECALDLVLRGHRLVADDVVLIKQHHAQLVGTGSMLTRHHMEVRGLGIINAKELFGAAAVCSSKPVELVIDLIEGKDTVDGDRTGLDDRFETILEVAIPKLRLPVRPGRNVASIVEVAARNHLLKLQGHNAALELKDRIDRQLAARVVAKTDGAS